MAEFPALPLWTDAYLGDTTHLTTIQHGIYLLLLFAAWRSKDCRLPDDDKLLARYAHLTTQQWVRHRPTIAPFWAITDGQWSNARLSDERDTVKRQRDQRSMAGTASALKRLHRNSTAVQRKSNGGEAPTPTPTPTPILKKESSSKPPSGDFDGFWVCCPKKVGKVAAKKSYAKALLQTSPELLAAAMRRYAASRAGEPEQYTAHPAKWLNDGRWTDEANGLNGAEATAEQIAAAADKSDRYFKRGKYAETTQ